MSKESMFKREGSKGRRLLDEVKQFSTLIGAQTKLVGRLESADDTIIDGSVEGQCVVDGVLIIGEDGSWQGNIEAQNVIVSGEVKGDILVHSKLELTKTARVSGRISSPTIAVAEGAVHDGEVHMSKEGDIVHFTDRRSGENS